MQLSLFCNMEMNITAEMLESVAVTQIYVCFDKKTKYAFVVISVLSG